MRLIDADMLAKELNALHGDGDYEANIYCAEACYGLGKWIWENPEDYGLEEAIKKLEVAPTIDAVPVVRCKDCIYWERGDCYRLELSLPNDFCSYGKRKEKMGLSEPYNPSIPRDQWEDRARFE